MSITSRSPSPTWSPPNNSTRRSGSQPNGVSGSTGPAAALVTGISGARLEMAFLMLGGFRLELIEYTPRGSDDPRAGNDLGSSHICLQVDRIEDVYLRLAARGVSFISTPHHDPSGVSMTYFSDPDGNRLELLEITDSQ